MCTVKIFNSGLEKENKREEKKYYIVIVSLTAYTKLLYSVFFL